MAGQSTFREAVPALLRGIKELRRHKVQTGLGAISLGVVLDPFNWVSWSEVGSLGNWAMTAVLGAEWAVSPAFRLICLGIAIFMLWWIGRRAEMGDQAVIEQSRAIAEQVAARRNRDMAKWDRMAELYFRQKRFDDALVAMARLRSAISSYPGQLEAVKQYDSNIHFAVKPWEGLGHDALEALQSVSRLLQVEAPGIKLHEPEAPTTEPKGAVPISYFDEERAAGFMALHHENQRALTTAMRDLQSKMDCEREALDQLRARVDGELQ